MTVHFLAAELQKLDPQLQLEKRAKLPQQSNSKASGKAWADLERQEKAASQARIAQGPKLSAQKAQTNVHKV